jgi:hypothetical protein
MAHLLVLTTALATSAPAPFWTAPRPNASLPLFGYAQIPGVQHTGVFFGSQQGGWYNHAVMMQWFDGVLTLSWKNAPEKEDTPGQRVLYAQSTDGKHWTTPTLLFPNMSTSAHPVAQFAGPFAVLNGHLYASASPAIIADGDAQGAQFCLWPDGIDPRNCESPADPGYQPAGLLMLRRVYGPHGGASRLGPAFFASAAGPPPELEEARNLTGVRLLHDMDAETQADVQALVGSGTADGFEPPCGRGSGSGTLKCEGCPGGCALYAESKGVVRLANERCHYATSSFDVNLFRTKDTQTLAASVRKGAANPKQSGWSPVGLTDIPNDSSNLNCGSLPSGKAFVVSNAAPAPRRDPLTLATSADGLNFSTCQTVATCTTMLPGKSGCGARYEGNHNVGPSYPQAVSVVAPAPEAVRALYVASTNNKEDVVVSRVPWGGIGA